ncbi:MAG: hypothetical protein AABX29_02520 [Nanoarchaeota archaeon]
MFEKREAGLNFSQFKYKLLDKFTFIPHIRSNNTAAIPYSIIDNFDHKSNVAFLKIYDGKSSKLRIKKLHSAGNSLIVSLKAEKELRDIKIQVLDIKSEKELLDRRKIDFIKYLPKFTLGGTPIYVFDYDPFYIIGGYYKKDILVTKNLLKYENLPSVLGLYLAEGGKVDATFTNSWPEAINVVLDFVEKNFEIHRDNVLASICCNPNLKSKREELEAFWNRKTGVKNFFSSLHINKNVKSPQGILELYFSSQILKELFVNLSYKVDLNGNQEFINGFLSGDGSPILQNKACITHHVVFDSKKKNYYKYKKIFKNYKTGIINDNRLVIYANWDQNLELLMNKVYTYSPMKRFRFLKYFLSLPKTKLNKHLTKIKELSKEFENLRLYLINFYQSLAISNIYNKEEINKIIEKLK